MKFFEKYFQFTEETGQIGRKSLLIERLYGNCCGLSRVLIRGCV